MTLVLAALLTVGAVAAIFHPLLTGKEAPMGASEDEVTDVQHRKRMALISLRDVEYDFHAGKLDEADYRELKAQVSAEALAALDEESRGLAAAGAAAASTGTGAARGGGAAPAGARAQADVEAEIAALRESIRHGRICTQCGHPNPLASRFCGECGAALTAASGPGGPPA